MWHQQPDLAYPNPAPPFYRNTIKTGNSASDSTLCDDDSRYRPGITSVSRPRADHHLLRRTSISHPHPHPHPHPHSHSHHPHPSTSRPLIQDSSTAHHCRKQPPDLQLDHPRPRHYPQPQPHHPLKQQQQHRPQQPRQPQDISPYSSGEIPFVPYVGRMSKDQFINVVALTLDTNAEHNTLLVSLPTYSEPESVFFSVSRPEIPTRDYVKRLVTYTQCSPSAFVVMMVYLDRIAKSNPRLRVTPYNMHRLLVTSLTLACKMLDDRCFSNVHYAKVGGIPTAREMNRLELQFLNYVNYRLHVDLDAYQFKTRTLECQPLPTSPVSIFEGSTAMSSSLDKEDLQSMVSSAESGTSVSVSARTGYHVKTDSSHSHYPAVQGNAGMEKWHRGRTPHPPGSKSAYETQLQQQHNALLAAQQVQRLNEMVP